MLAEACTVHHFKGVGPVEVRTVHDFEGVWLAEVRTVHHFEGVGPIEVHTVHHFAGIGPVELRTVHHFEGIAPPEARTVHHFDGFSLQGVQINKPELRVQIHFRGLGGTLKNVSVNCTFSSAQLAYCTASLRVGVDKFGNTKKSIFRNAFVRRVGTEK